MGLGGAIGAISCTCDGGAGGLYESGVLEQQYLGTELANPRLLRAVHNCGHINKQLNALEPMVQGPATKPVHVILAK